MYLIVRHQKGIPFDISREDGSELTCDFLCGGHVGSPSNGLLIEDDADWFVFSGIYRMGEVGSIDQMLDITGYICNTIPFPSDHYPPQKVHSTWP